MSAYLDLIISIAVASTLSLMVMTMHANLLDTASKGTLEIDTQQRAAGIAQEVGDDLRKIGYLVTSGSKITAADSTSITFRSVIYDTGSVYSVRWYLGPTSELTNTPNPNDRFLYRDLNASAATRWSEVVSDFHLTYYDSQGLLTTTPSAIRRIRVDLRVESSQPYVTGVGGGVASYPKTFLQFEVRPKNL